MPYCEVHRYKYTNFCVVCQAEKYHVDQGNEDNVPYFRAGVFNEPFYVQIPPNSHTDAARYETAYNHGKSFQYAVETKEEKKEMGDRFYEDQKDRTPTDSFNINGNIKSAKPDVVQLGLDFNSIDLGENVDEVSFNECVSQDIQESDISSITEHVVIVQGINEPIELNPIFDNEIVLYRPREDVIAEELAKKAQEAVNKATDTVKSQFNDRNTGFKLYELTGLVQAVLNQCEDYAQSNEGEIPISMGEVLEHLEMEREQKLINCCLVYKDLMYKSDMIMNEVISLTKRAKALKTKADSMKNYVSDNIRNRETFNDPRIDIPWRKSTSTDIINLALVPDDLCNHNVTTHYCNELQTLLAELEGTGELMDHVKIPRKKDLIKPKLEKGEDVPGMKLNKKDSFKIK